MSNPANRPITIVECDDGNRLCLKANELKNILLKEDIKDHYVVVVSIAGPFRKGKSFLLNLLLLYMKFQYGSLEDSGKSSWLEDENELVTGFSWSGGSRRNTTGIVMWPEIFRTTLPNDKKVAIILLDTQGTFDSTSTVRECATIFALSTMLSSVQVYNLHQNIQENDLQHLQLFTEYGRLAKEDTLQTAFQKLFFLVRDWPYSYEAMYGKEGGGSVLQDRLQITDQQAPELQSVRMHIKSSFKDIECFLMPNPGPTVMTSESVDIRLSDIAPEFKVYLQQLTSTLLSPPNLVKKKINGETVTVKGLLSYFYEYTKLFNGNTLPEPRTILDVTAEANNLSAMFESKEKYKESMQEVWGSENCLSAEFLKKMHELSKESALLYFQKKRKMGSSHLSNLYLQRLETEIENDYKQCVAHNESKAAIQKIKSVAKTVATVVIATAYTFFTHRLPPAV